LSLQKSVLLRLLAWI